MRCSNTICRNTNSFANNNNNNNNNNVDDKIIIILPQSSPPPYLHFENSISTSMIDNFQLL